jgi:polysaccharide deacetylase 2 family uncharacterized protein YibQ
VPVIAPGIVPTVAIIIDDIGYSLAQGRRAIGLPGAVTCSILPGTPHAHTLAGHARHAGKEIMLHLPMQGSGASPNEPESLSGEMLEEQFRATLREHLAALPDAVGVNNHMGSNLTPLPQQMDWLMGELAERRLYFVDSRTTHLTVTENAALTHRVPFMERDVFLDNDDDPVAIENAFNQLIRKAKKRGHAIGIAHARRSTLAALEQLLPKLSEQGVVLEPVSGLMPRTHMPANNLTARNLTAPGTPAQHAQLR